MDVKSTLHRIINLTTYGWFLIYRTSCSYAVKESVLDTSIVLLLNWVSCIALFFSITQARIVLKLSKLLFESKGPSKIRTGLRFFYDLLRDTMSFRMFRTH